MKNSTHEKYLIAGLVVMIVIFAFGAHIATAAAGTPAANAATTGEPSGLTCATHLPTCLIYYISFVTDSFLGGIISLGALVIGWGINLDGNVFNSPVIQTGFSDSLTIANLGFVLGIIIIALATILRRETYGIKKLLWKLVVMAIFVNFGLVITAPIVGFANDLTTYFVNQGGGTNFETQLTAAFAPQVLFDPSQLGATVPATAMSSACGVLGIITRFDLGIGIGPSANEVQNDCIGAANVITNSNIPPVAAAGDDLFRQIMSMLFSGIFLAIVAFTFLTIGILLVIRYVYLGVLLILLPLAWLMWIFPKFSGHFTKWWGDFIRWTFFPALSLFFIYLAMTTVTSVATITTSPASGSTATSTTVNPTVLNIPGSFLDGGSVNPDGVAALMVGTGQTGLWQTALDELLLVGLCLGGLMAANKLSITGADVAIKAGKSASAAIGGYVGKQSKKAGRAAFRGVGGERAIQKMRSGEVGLGRLGKIPILGTGANWALKRGASLAGRAAQPHLNNRAMVEEAKKKVPDNVKEIKENLMGNMNTEDILAHISKLREKGELTKDTLIKGKRFADFSDTNEKTFAAYGWGKDAKDADKALGSNKKMRGLENEIGRLSKAGASTAVSLAQLNTATEEFVKTWERGDITKLNANAVLGEKTEISQALARYFANNANQYASAVLPKMKSAQLESFNKMYVDIIKQEEAGARRVGDIGRAERLIAPKDKNGKIEAGKQPGALEKHERAMGSNATNLHGGGSGGSAPTPTAPHP